MDTEKIRKAMETNYLKATTPINFINTIRLSNHTGSQEEYNKKILILIEQIYSNALLPDDLLNLESQERMATC